MGAEVLSLGALGAVIILSSRRGVHAGTLALALAGLIGRYALGLDAEQLARLFPSGLLLMLFGVTLLFGMARANGTLDALAGALLRWTGCRPRLLPGVFFLLALALSAIGAGNIAAVALLAPVAMETAHRTGIGPVLTTFMLVTGANAGAFSPLSFTGVIASALTRQAGLALDPWTDIFAPSLATQAALAAAGYALAWPGLLKIQASVEPPETPEPSVEQRVTFGALAALAAAVLGLKMDVGVAALVLAAGLELAKAADHKSALERIPWSAIMMVCGVATLVAVAAQSGGMSQLAGWLVRAGSARAVTATAAFAGAFTSIYSSSSGVVMPAFLTMVPELSARSGAPAASLASAINVASHLVDISPLSTLGALCVAAVPEGERGKAFQRLFYGGLGMSLVAAAMGYLVFGAS